MANFKGRGFAPAPDLDMPHAVIRFTRDVTFPRFSMKAGETWGFVVFKKWAQRLQQIKDGHRFEFAGGQCLPQDVEIIYEGPCGREYSIACDADVRAEYELGKAKSVN